MMLNKKTKLVHYSLRLLLKEKERLYSNRDDILKNHENDVLRKIALTNNSNRLGDILLGINSLVAMFND